MNTTFQNGRSSSGMTTGSMSTANNMVKVLNQMCYTNFKMCTNLPAFYRSLINKINDVNTGDPIFDYNEAESIVEAAIGEKIPLVTAKRWAITDKKKGQVQFGKS